jgi:hypothetical protein
MFTLLVLFFINFCRFQTYSLRFFSRIYRLVVTYMLNFTWSISYSHETKVNVNMYTGSERWYKG